MGLQRSCFVSTSRSSFAKTLRTASPAFSLPNGHSPCRFFFRLQIYLYISPVTDLSLYSFFSRPHTVAKLARCGGLVLTRQLAEMYSFTSIPGRTYYFSRTPARSSHILSVHRLHKKNILRPASKKFGSVRFTTPTAQVFRPYQYLKTHAPHLNIGLLIRSMCLCDLLVPNALSQFRLQFFPKKTRFQVFPDFLQHHAHEFQRASFHIVAFWGPVSEFPLLLSFLPALSA